MQAERQLVERVSVRTLVNYVSLGCVVPIIASPNGEIIFGLGSGLLQPQLLYPPIGSFGYIDLVIGRTGERMRAGELAEIAPGPANHTQNFAIERDFEDAPRKS